MRNPEAFQMQRLVDFKARSKIVSQQPSIGRLERLDGQRLASLGHRMDLLLELGKHRLPHNRRADAVDLMIDDRCFLLRTRGSLDERAS